MARRRSLLLATAVGVQKSGTLLANVGPANVHSHVVLTTANARTTTGAAQFIQDSITTDNECNAGATVKYINLFIQTAPRQSISTEEQRVGWLEYAFVLVKESDTVVPTTQLGVSTLGDVCTKMFRNECIWTGNIPIGETQSNSLALKIKILKFKQKIRIGDEWRFICHFRSSLSTSTQTATNRLLTSFLYKVYN